jgi:anti-anti-sigma regulatory factor
VGYAKMPVVRRRDPATISVSRSVIVRVQGALVEDSVETLERMIHDLIADQGVRDLIVDLSEAVEINDAVQAVLERAMSMATSKGGCVTLRAPAELPQPLVDAAADVPTFVALEPEGSGSG